VSFVDQSSSPFEKGKRGWRRRAVLGHVFASLMLRKRMRKKGVRYCFHASKQRHEAGLLKVPVAGKCFDDVGKTVSGTVFFMTRA
jgi:hypothetical protein